MDDKEAEELRKDLLEMMESIQKDFGKIAEALNDISQSFNNLIDSVKQEDFSD